MVQMYALRQRGAARLQREYFGLSIDIVNSIRRQEWGEGLSVAQQTALPHLGAMKKAYILCKGEVSKTGFDAIAAGDPNLAAGSAFVAAKLAQVAESIGSSDSHGLQAWLHDLHSELKKHMLGKETRHMFDNPKPPLGSSQKPEGRMFPIRTIHVFAHLPEATRTVFHIPAPNAPKAIIG